jgi:hypothetical protein
VLALLGSTRGPTPHAGAKHRWQRDVPAAGAKKKNQNRAGGRKSSRRRGRGWANGFVRREAMMRAAKPSEARVEIETLVRITAQGKKLVELLSSQTPAVQAQTYRLLSKRVRQAKRGKNARLEVF